MVLALHDYKERWSPLPVCLRRASPKTLGLEEGIVYLLTEAIIRWLQVMVQLSALRLPPIRVTKGCLPELGSYMTLRALALESLVQPILRTERKVDVQKALASRTLK